jgi:hypothetical protein
MQMCVLDKKEQKDMHMLDKKEQKDMHMFCVCTCLHLITKIIKKKEINSVAQLLVRCATEFSNSMVHPTSRCATEVLHLVKRGSRPPH